MRSARVLSIALTVLALTTMVGAQVQQPAPGSALRKQILDGLRPAIQKDLKQKVIFKVDDIRVLNGWAYLHVHPIQPNGKPIDFKKTQYRKALEEGMFDGDSTYALMHLVKKQWRVKEYAIGPTDVVWSGWIDAPYHPPKAFFPPLGG